MIGCGLVCISDDLNASSAQLTVQKLKSHIQTVEGREAKAQLTIAQLETKLMELERATAHDHSLWNHSLRAMTALASHHATSAMNAAAAAATKGLSPSPNAPASSAGSGSTGGDEKKQPTPSIPIPIPIPISVGDLTPAQLQKLTNEHSMAIHQLQAIIDQAEIDRASMRKQVMEVQDSKAAAEAAARKDNSNHERELSELSAKLARVSDDLARRTAALEDASRRVAAGLSMAEHDKIVWHLKSIHTNELNQLRSQLEDARTASVRAAAIVQSTTAATAANDAELTALKQQNTALDVRVRQLSDQLKSAKAAAATAEAKSDPQPLLTAQQQKYESQLAELKVSLCAANDDKASNRKLATEYEHQLSTLTQQTIPELNAHISQLTADVAHHQSLTAKLQSEIDDKQKALSDWAANELKYKQQLEAQSKT